MKRVMYFSSAAVLLVASTVYSQQPTGQKIGHAIFARRQPRFPHPPSHYLIRTQGGFR